MTKEEQLKQEAEVYSYKLYHSKAWNPGEDMLVKAYLAGTEPREKRIAELEKENAELKEKYLYVVNRSPCLAELEENITKAKEIIKMFLKYEVCTLNIKDELADNIKKAEQFLSEVEK